MEQSPFLWIVTVMHKITDSIAVNQITFYKEGTRFMWRSWKCENRTSPANRFHCCNLGPNDSPLLLGNSKVL